jgi:NAD(P)-dependent dehydrogenase (short-subunit alcohol dehydrogenase family)
MVNATAVVIGANGGIGAALVSALAASGDFATVHALSRAPAHPDDTIDVTDEASIAAAAAKIATPIDLLIVATGMLHENGRMPEKSLRALDGPTLARMFEVNTIGPALVLKHFTPLLARDRRSVVAILSARVGSISDNRSGGWYGYRASKAALNMIVKSAAIELARTRKHAICVSIHPGTVKTALSSSFVNNASSSVFTPEHSAQCILAVLDGLKTADTGRIFAWDAKEITP